MQCDVTFDFGSYISQMFLSYGSLKLANCSVDLIGKPTEAVVVIVDDFSKHTKTVLFGYSCSVVDNGGKQAMFAIIDSGEKVVYTN